MKKLIVIVGLTGAILTAIGVYFKMMHWPGAAVAILIASISLFVYSLLLLFEQLKVAGSNIDKTFIVTFGFTGACLSISFLFKMLHWPGANILIYAFFIFYLILILVSVARVLLEKDKDKQFWYINYFVWLLGGLLMLTFPLIIRFFTLR